MHSAEISANTIPSKKRLLWRILVLTTDDGIEGVWEKVRTSNAIVSVLLIEGRRVSIKAIQKVIFDFMPDVIVVDNIPSGRSAKDIVQFVTTRFPGLFFFEFTGRDNTLNSANEKIPITKSASDLIEAIATATDLRGLENYG